VLLFTSLVVFIGGIALQAIPDEYWIDHTAAGWWIIGIDMMFLMYLAGVVCSASSRTSSPPTFTAGSDGAASAD
jgi:hypothetical protein